MIELHPLHYNGDPHHLYVYALEDAPEHLVVIKGDAYTCTLYLYALHEQGGDYNSERIAWTKDDGAPDELIRALLRITDRADLEAIDLESWAHDLTKYTACWHYGSHYAHSPYTLATVLARAGFTTMEQVKDSDRIHQLVAQTLTPTSEPAPRHPFDGRASIALNMGYDLKDRRIGLCVARDSFDHCTAHMTLDEARAVYAKLGDLITRLDDFQTKAKP